jgi:membrane protease YdiL (CAAX protease family)
MEYPRKKIMVLAVTMEGLALLLAVFLAWYFGISLMPLSENYLRDILIGTAGALVPFVFFLFLMTERAGKVALFGSLRRIVTTGVKEIFSNAKLIDLIVISLIAGISEELLFRGVLQAQYGIVAASIVFGLAHCISAAYVITAAIMGFYIGAFYYFSNSLLVPVQIHFIYDLGALIYLRYFFSTNGNRVRCS